jgi:hypothetical protein
LFLQELQRHPKAFLGKESGESFLVNTKNTKVMVFQETVHSFYIVLPKLKDDFGFIQDPFEPEWLSANTNSALFTLTAINGASTCPAFSWSIR